MNTFIVLLRAVNVGGTGKLPMTALRSMCEAEGFTRVRTYIASGNVVLNSALTARQVKTALEKRLAEYAGKPVGVVVRSGGEMASVLAANPFPDALGNQVAAIFLDEPPPADALSAAVGVADEVMAPGTREIYVHYPSGMGRSRLKIPAARNGTARNMNTVAKLVEMAADG